MHVLNKTNSHEDSAKHGFSLVETVLALGIMGLAITALLGLLPHGIEMTRRAGNISSVSRIVSNISSELSLFHFTNLSTLGTVTLLYDDQGTKLESGAGGGDSLVAFVAEVTVDPAGTLLPTSTGGLQTKILPVRVNIAATPNTRFDFVSASPNSYISVPVLIGPTFQN